MAIQFRVNAQNMPQAGDTIEVRKHGTSTLAAITDRYGNAISTQPYTIAPDAEGWWGIDTVLYERVDVLWNGVVWFKGAIIADPVPVAGEVKTIKAPPLPTQAVIDKAVSQGFAKENIEVIYASNTEPSDADFIDQMIALGLSRENLFWRDTSAFNPVVDSVTIASGDYTTSTSITLDLTSTDPGEMMIAEDAGFTTRTDGLAVAWEPFAASKTWTIPATEGTTTTIYVKYRNAELVETAAVSDSVILDTQAPVLTFTPTGGDLYTDTSVSVTATDSVSGVMGIYMTTDGTTPTYPPTGTTFLYNGAVLHLENNVSRTISALAVDNAGLASAVQTHTYTEHLPEVATFEVGTASGMAIPITGFTALATGVTIDGYLITESSNRPTSSPPHPSVSTMADWSATPPSSYTSTKTGSVSIYPWVKAGSEVSFLKASLAKSFNASSEVSNVAPNAPTGLASSALLADGTGFTLSWTAATDSDGTIASYKIYKGGVLHSTSTTTSKAITGEPVASSATWTVSAVDNDGAESVPSSGLLVQLVDSTAPVITFDLPATAESLTVTGITFSATDADANLQYAMSETDHGPSGPADGWTSSPSSSFTFAAEGTRTLYVWVKDSANVSKASDTITITLPAGDPIPAAPTGASLTAGDGLVTMDPGTATYATSYNAYYTLDGTTPTTADTKIPGVVAGQTLTVANGTTCTMIYTAQNDSGESPATSPFTATPVAGVILPDLTLLDDYNRTDGTTLSGNANYIIPPGAPDRTLADFVLDTGKLKLANAVSNAPVSWNADFNGLGSAFTLEFDGQSQPNPESHNFCNFLFRGNDYTISLSHGWMIALVDSFDVSSNVTSHRFRVSFYSNDTLVQSPINDATTYTKTEAIRGELNADGSITVHRKSSLADSWSLVGTYPVPDGYTAPSQIKPTIQLYNYARVDNLRGGNV